jgi:hypothetical protein
MFGIAECSHSLEEGFDSSTENLGFLFLLISILTIVCGTLILLADKYWGPRSQKKYLKKSPFTDLKRIGFEQNENEYIGIIEDYTIIIGYNWFGEGLHQCIYIKALFKSTESNKLFDFKIFDYLTKKYSDDKINWDINSALINIPFNFKRPKVEKIETVIKRIIKVFQEEKFEKISLNEYKGFDISQYQITDKNDNPVTKRARNLEPIPKKHWYNKFQFVFLILFGLLALYSIHIYRLTLIPWQFLFIPPIIGLIIVNLLTINLIRKAKKKVDLIIMNVVFGLLLGYSFFLLTNFYVKTETKQEIQVEIVDISKTSDGDVFIDVENSEFKKELVVTSEDLKIIGENKTLYLIIEKGVFEYWVIRNISLTKAKP